MLSSLSRPKALAVCALPVVALFAVVALAPLPYAIAQPGTTADVLGEDKGQEVITITGAPVRPSEGQLRMTTIVATGPSTDVDLGDVTDAWFRTDRAVLPRDSVYPPGKSDAEVEKHNLGQMKESQDAATLAALDYLDEDPEKVKVTLHLADIGGPSAGLLFSSASSRSSTATAPAAISPAAGSSPVRGRSTRTARSAPSAASR